MTLDVGIHDAVSMDAYRRDELRPEPTLSRSGIVQIMTPGASMADYAAQQTRLRNPEWPAIEDDSTPATDMGEIVHGLVLGVGAKFIASSPGEHGTVASGKNKGKPYSTWTGAAKEWKEEQEANGSIVIDYDTEALVRYLAAKLTDAIVARHGAKQWDNRRVEQTMIWPRTLNDGSVIYHRARPDVLLPNAVMLDPKTTALCVSDADLGKVIAAKGFDFQHALYQDGRRTLEGLPFAPKFEFAYIRTIAPYTIRFVDLERIAIPWDLRVTRMRSDIASHRFGECVRTTKWPDHPIDASPVPPSWFVAMTEAQVGLGEIEAS